MTADNRSNTLAHDPNRFPAHQDSRRGLRPDQEDKLWFTDLCKVLGISLLAQRDPRRWEKYLAFVFPALFVEVFLEVNKRAGAATTLLDRYMYE